MVNLSCAEVKISQQGRNNITAGVYSIIGGGYKAVADQDGVQGVDNPFLSEICLFHV